MRHEIQKCRSGVPLCRDVSTEGPVNNFTEQENVDGRVVWATFLANTAGRGVQVFQWIGRDFPDSRAWLETQITGRALMSALCNRLTRCRRLLPRPELLQKAGCWEI